LTPPSLNPIRIRGARQHNLKNISLDIPRNQLVVITGVSGSGKSSLAFDTLYAEGQRRYVQSLSAYARQFLDQLQKPDVDFIEGLSPAVAIEQSHSNPNPRSTIATITEIYDYLRILYAISGIPHDPATGERLTRHTSEQIGQRILDLPEGSKIFLLAPLFPEAEDSLSGLFEKLRRQGFVRIRVDGSIHELDETDPKTLKQGVELEIVVDRLIVREGIRSRLMDSIETTLRWSPQEVRILINAAADGPDSASLLSFNTAYANTRTGYLLEKLTPQHFSFNTHLGACPTCQGVGTLLAPDPKLILPNHELSISAGAIKSWWTRVPKMKQLQQLEIEALARHFAVSTEKPLSELPADFIQALLHGTGSTAISTGWKTAENRRSLAKPFEGLIPEARRLYQNAESEALRTQLSRLMSAQTCAACRGQRLRPEALAVTLESAAMDLPTELGIHQLAALSIDQALTWINAIRLSEQQSDYLRDLLREISSRIRFLQQVGLGYLTLDRRSGSLSGGEMQRIRLATQIGSALSGVLYVLDEPSIGLHPADTQRLLDTLTQLRDLGNSVIVVEHDETLIRHADWLVELGPGAGQLGGQLIAQAPPALLHQQPDSITGPYLSGKNRVQVRHQRRQPSSQLPLLQDSPTEGWLTIHQATEHNLQTITAAFPLHCFTAVTGPSGSGKSTLIESILMRALMRHFHQSKAEPGAHSHLSGLRQIDKVIIIDQEPIGRSPRSNPATFTGLFTPMRELFAKLPAARQRGYDAGRFSFNTPGGRCEKCQGDGQLKIDMHFLADIYVTCDHCQGRRYNSETLEVTFRGRNIAEVLEMTISEAHSFFGKNPVISPKLQCLEATGLGYLKLGQPANTLSGGEAQRIKLAAELSKRSAQHTLYLLDEPTTGLHFADIQKLLEVLFSLRDAGHSIIVIEHNLDVIRNADWIIDLGPGGGPHGGQIVACGPPETIMPHPHSLTGKHLAATQLFIEEPT
jgi:excinuclease ABC subunit A